MSLDHHNYGFWWVDDKFIIAHSELNFWGPLEFGIHYMLFLFLDQKSGTLSRWGNIFWLSCEILALLTVNFCWRCFIYHWQARKFWKVIFQHYYWNRPIVEKVARLSTNPWDTPLEALANVHPLPMPTSCLLFINQFFCSRHLLLCRT